MNKRKIPASYPQVTDEDENILHEVVKGRWYTERTYCRKFARELCKVAGTKHALLVNSGSSATFIALKTLFDFFPGKYVLTCACGFPTTVAPIYQHGRIPLYIDIDPKTLSPNMGQIAYMLDKYGEYISGAIFIHTLGFPFNEPLVREMLGSDRFFVADNCDALGSTIDGFPAGTWADISTYSFFPAHHIFSGEGGALTLNDDKFVKRASQYINWGRDCNCLPGQDNVCGNRFGYKWDKLPEGWDHKYTFTQLGYNLKMTEFQGALGFSQIQRLLTIVERRIENTIKLLDVIRPYTNYIDFVESEDGYRPSPFGFLVILRDKYKTLINPMIQYLEENGIATRRMFGGNLTRQPGFQNLQYITVPDLDGSDKLLEQSFWIGCGPHVSEDDIKYIAYTFKNFFDERGLY